MIVGIDLGTTHSLVGVYGQDGPRLIPNALGELLTPSVVSVDEEGRLMVGRVAHERLLSHPENSVATFKRWMGTQRETKLGGRQYRPEELSALVLRALLDDARNQLGQDVTEAVISVPAYFGDAQRKATRAAGELAGIRVERLINEPTAAAVAYGLQERVDGSTFIVLDLGGGTFDVSILEIFDGVVQVHASAGDNHLGGEDFLSLLVSACCSDHKLKREALSRQELAQLQGRMEILKQQLSNRERAGLKFSVSGKEYEWEMDEARFQDLADPLIQRIRQPIERALRDAHLAPEQLQEVIMVGGASRMPVFTRLATRMLGRLPLRHVNPDQAIALGASIVAGMKSRNHALEEIVLTDVCPYTLGVGTGRTDEHGRVTTGYFSPLIERNTTVPVSRVEVFAPLQDGQSVVDLEIFQGESPRTANNVLLGNIHVVLPRNQKRENNSIEVRFTYDVNGVLQVETKLLATGERQELILEGTPGVLTKEEIRERLAQLQSLKIHPREDQANLAAIARAERVYEENLDLRQTVHEWLASFMGVIESQDLHQIARHRGELTRALDELESRRW